MLQKIHEIQNKGVHVRIAYIQTYSQAGTEAFLNG